VLDILTKLVKHSSSFERKNERDGMLSFATSLTGVPIEPAELDAHPMLLNCRNGVVDLKTGTLIPHADTRGYFLTKQAKIEYDPNATCLRWKRFLVEVFDGDVDLIAYIQRCAGYWLSGDVSEKAIWFFFGNGNNGKTTLLKIIREALGLKEYAGLVDINTLMKKTSDDYSLRMTAMLQGMRFVTASEASEGCVLNEALIKHLTGMDDLVGRHIYGKTFEFPATHKIIVDANHRPEIHGTDEAIWLRLHLVPFKVMFSNDPVQRDAGAKPMDKNLWQDLRAELPGILAWAVRGAVEWQHDGGLQPPQAIIDAIREYRAEQDVVGRFLEQRCLRDPQAMIRPSDLFAAFQTWCAEHGVQNLRKQPWLTKKVKEKKFTTDHNENGDFFIGLRLRSGVAWEVPVPAPDEPVAAG
jgi:putative DNA primase/helicase